MRRINLKELNRIFSETAVEISPELTLVLKPLPLSKWAEGLEILQPYSLLIYIAVTSGIEAVIAQVIQLLFDFSSGYRQEIEALNTYDREVKIYDLELKRRLDLSSSDLATLPVLNEPQKPKDSELAAISKFRIFEDLYKLINLLCGDALPRSEFDKWEPEQLVQILKIIYQQNKDFFTEIFRLKGEGKNEKVDQKQIGAGITT